jgi:hypothetical protein
MASKSPDEITRLFSDLMFEKRLSQIAEGFCPYCAVALGERVPWGGGEFVLSRCPCCGWCYRTLISPKQGPGWISVGTHYCAHTSAWDRWPTSSARRLRCAHLQQQEAETPTDGSDFDPTIRSEFAAVRAL